VGTAGMQGLDGRVLATPNLARRLLLLLRRCGLLLGLRLARLALLLLGHRCAGASGSRLPSYIVDVRRSDQSWPGFTSWRGRGDGEGGCALSVSATLGGACTRARERDHSGLLGPAALFLAPAPRSLPSRPARLGRRRCRAHGQPPRHSTGARGASANQLHFTASSWRHQSVASGKRPVGKNTGREAPRQSIGLPISTFKMFKKPFACNQSHNLSGADRKKLKR
jgi:hypothetical protein